MKVVHHREGGTPVCLGGSERLRQWRLEVCDGGWAVLSTRTVDQLQRAVFPGKNVTPLVKDGGAKEEGEKIGAKWCS